MQAIMGYKNEAEATTAWRNKQRSIYDHNFFSYKIPDEGRSMKPCDILGVRDGIAFACEVKFFNLKRGITYEDILHKCQFQQLLTLESYVKAGGQGLLLGYNQRNDTFYLYDYKKKGMKI